MPKFLIMLEVNRPFMAMAVEDVETTLAKENVEAKILYCNLDEEEED